MVKRILHTRICFALRRMQRYPQSHARKLCYANAGFGESRSGSVLRPHMVSVVQSNELWKSLKLRWLLRWVKESTRSTRAVAGSGKGTGEVRLWIATPERGMFSPEVFLSLLKLIYGRAHEGIGTIELMPLAGTIFATRRIKLSRWMVKTIFARCSVTWPMSPSLPLRSGNWERASWKQHKNFLPAST